MRVEALRDENKQINLDLDFSHPRSSSNGKNKK